RVRGAGDAPEVPGPGGALLELTALDRIASVDGAACIARVEAGCSMAALEAAAGREGCTLGALLPSVRAGSVGHWLAGPTGGERGIPGSRRETAALSVTAVLASARIAESRAVPRSAAGPDLDHLALGGAGRLAVIAAAVIRLLPEAPLLAVSWEAGSTGAAVEALARFCLDRLAPTRVRLAVLPDGSVRLAAGFEGSRSAQLLRQRAARTARHLFKELREIRSGELRDERSEGDAAAAFLRAPAPAHAVEIDADWECLRSWALQPAASAPGSELALCGLHAGGAFAVLSVPGEGDQPADASAVSAREAGARVIAPRRLRARAQPWEELGGGQVWRRLVAALGVEEEQP
ncbi:MAG TPA: FAD-binding protein, partial [Myxococcales bacterium]|nr:FAD-binding protein [Myxococcales bacterium]